MYNILFTSEMSSSCKLETPNPSREKIICPVTLRGSRWTLKGINPAHNIKTIPDGHTPTKQALLKFELG